MSNKKRTVWKIIRLVTAVLLLLFFIFVVSTAIRNYNYSGTYPYPSIGGDINNWVDATVVDVGIYIPFLFVPLTSSLILFIISCVKLRKNSKNSSTDKA